MGIFSGCGKKKEAVDDEFPGSVLDALIKGYDVEISPTGEVADLTFRRGEFEKALRLYGTALSQNPYDHRSAYLRGCLLIEVGRLDEAKEAFEDLLSRKPAAVSAEWLLDFIDRRQKSPDEALKESISGAFAEIMGGQPDSSLAGMAESGCPVLDPLIQQSMAGRAVFLPVEEDLVKWLLGGDFFLSPEVAVGAIELLVDPETHLDALSEKYGDVTLFKIQAIALGIKDLEKEKRFLTDLIREDPLNLYYRFLLRTCQDKLDFPDKNSRDLPPYDIPVVTEMLSWDQEGATFDVGIAKRQKAKAKALDHLALPFRPEPQLKRPLNHSWAAGGIMTRLSKTCLELVRQGEKEKAMALQRLALKTSRRALENTPDTAFPMLFEKFAALLLKPYYEEIGDQSALARFKKIEENCAGRRKLVNYKLTANLTVLDGAGPVYWIPVPLIKNEVSSWMVGFEDFGKKEVLDFSIFEGVD
ncbi:MAG: tetratricopeptide repeat protein [Verrucomicrobiota bacterium]